MLVTRFSGLTGTRAVSFSVCMRARGSVVKSGDYALPSHLDRRDYPFPDAAHVKIFSASRMALKEKEEAPWSSLSMAENVALCRITFSESFAGMNRSTHRCKTVVVGAAMFFRGVPLRFRSGRTTVHRPFPHTFEEEWVTGQTQRMLGMKVSLVQGFSAKWDYDKNR